MGFLKSSVTFNVATLPHPMSVRAGILGFYFFPVLMLGLFVGSSEGVAGFLITIRMLPLIHCFWLGNVLTITVGTTLSMHLIMNVCVRNRTSVERTV